MPRDANNPTADDILDEYLVVQSQLGDAAAFSRLVRRWQGRVLRRAHYFTRDHEAAKDVAQESWMAVIRGLRSLRDPARFPAWTLQIVANKSRDWVRREDARRRATHGVEAEPARPDSTSNADLIERVRAGLAELDPGRRSVLRWFYLEGMSVAEIAEALDIPAGTVKSRLFHARDALRARLEET
ncbi:MAG: sigma-70 family RNA polymerase sigma factor [Gemmatimonadota bacterium]